MKVFLHHNNGQRDLKKWVGFSILSGVLVISVSWAPFSDQRFSVCLIKNLFGFSCPGCGMGRAFLYIGHAQIAKAIAINSNSLLAFPLIIFFWINSILSFALNKEIKIQLSTVEKALVIGSAVGLGLRIFFTAI